MIFIFNEANNPKLVHRLRANAERRAHHQKPANDHPEVYCQVNEPWRRRSNVFGGVH